MNRIRIIGIVVFIGSLLISYYVDTGDYGFLLGATAGVSIYFAVTGKGLFARRKQEQTD